MEIGDKHEALSSLHNSKDARFETSWSLDKFIQFSKVSNQLDSSILFGDKRCWKCPFTVGNMHWYATSFGKTGLYLSSLILVIPIGQVILHMIKNEPILKIVTAWNEIIL